MLIEDAARIIEAEASVLDYTGKLAVAQCICDNRFDESCFTQPMYYYSAESLRAAEDAMLHGKRRFPHAKLLQFRSFRKYGKNGIPDWDKIRQNVPADLEYLGKDGSGENGHYYFGVRLMRTWDSAVKTALTAYVQSKYYGNFVYLYGAKGVRLDTEQRIRDFMAAEPAYFSRYNEAERQQIIRNSLGRIAYDCSGFTGWLCTGDMQYSTGQIANSHDVTTDLSAGPAGSLLYTTYHGAGRHIGIDIGYGFCCDMAYESTDQNIALHRAGVRLYGIKDGITAWEKSGQSNVLDYTGADAR